MADVVSIAIAKERGSEWQQCQTPLRFNTYWRNIKTKEVRWTRPSVGTEVVNEENEEQPEPEPPQFGPLKADNADDVVDFAMPVCIKDLARHVRYNGQAGVVVDIDGSNKCYLRMPAALGGGLVSVPYDKLGHLAEHTNVYYDQGVERPSIALWQVDGYDDESNTYTIRLGSESHTCVAPTQLMPASAIPGLENIDKEGGFLQFTDKLGDRHNFHVRFPNRSVGSRARQAKHPLLIYLHGACRSHRAFYAFASKRQERFGLPAGLQFASENMIVVSPDCLWSWKESPYPWVAELVKVLSTATFVDPKRIYMLGLSMGGMGTWEIAAENPTLFAAIAPIAAHHKPKKRKDIAEALRGMPIWTRHCRNDDTCFLAYEEELWRTVESQNRTAPFEHEVLEEASHNTMCSVFVDSSEPFEFLSRFQQGNPKK